ncbi:MAG: lytic transglycosylase [Thiotrichaceae bacterium]|nr:MAG: lytic transglycosylase [Thiotrichaceae bacterium]
MWRILFFTLLYLPSLVMAEVKVPLMYQLVAEESRVPAKLFYALILNESRSLTTNNNVKKSLPWPWTINHRGKSHFFSSREKAFQYAKSLVAKNDSSFDVGLGQMNWRWHKDRFNSLWDAFEPYKNLSAAAAHFREQYERPECNKWELAVGCYHRPGQRYKDKQIAQNYTKRVIKLWTKI